MVSDQRGFCPTELARSLEAIYERYSGKFDFDGLTDKRAEQRRKELGWDLFGGFTFTFLKFLGNLRAAGHQRQPFGQTFKILISALDQPSLSASEREGKKIMGQINALIGTEISLYSQDLFERFAGNSDLDSLRAAFAQTDWDAVAVWLVMAKQRKELSRFMELVPAFKLGFWN